MSGSNNRSPVKSGSIAVSRALYSTDASVYRIEPLGVVVPRTRDDVVRTVEIAARHRVSITARGGGTSQAGQAIGAGLQLDTSKYLNRILELNVVERWAWIEPGVVLDELNAQLKVHGLRFAPDISTASRATIGGMMANNSSGARSVVYGKTIDHVLEQQVVLADGTVAHFRPLSAAELEAACSGTTLEAACYRTVRDLAALRRDEIDRRFPKVLRRVGGYNLDEFVDRAKPFNLAKLIVGSEGTLGLVVAAKINLVPLPAAKAVLTIEFEELLDALAATPLVLRHSPSAVEVMDRFILDHAKESPVLDALRRRILLGDPGALLCVEFYGDRAEDLPPRIDALEGELAASGYRCRWRRAMAPADQARIWAFREASLGLSMAMKGDGKSLSFVEDTAVAPEKLRDYIERFLRIIREHDTSAGVYAHASVGCLHVRPVVNLKTAEGVHNVRVDRERHRRSRARVRRRALRRARRRPRPRRLHREDVRPRAVRRVPHGEADVRSGGPVQPRQDRRHAADDVEPALRRRLPDAGSRPPFSTTPITAAWAARSRCAAASAPAARRSRARCARRTWRRGRRNTRRAGGRTRCGWRWPAGWAMPRSAITTSTTCSISASSAARARPSARSASTWRDSRASFSPATGSGTACR